MGGVRLNGLPGSPQTQPGGSYQVRVPYDWYGTVTPALVGYIFTPTSRDYGYTTAEQTGQNYQGIVVPTRRLSGQVKGNGTALPGVVLTVNPGEPTATDGGGQYEVIVNEGWSGSVI